MSKRIQRSLRQWSRLGIPVIAATVLHVVARAQSADALINKLVEKGILSLEEAQDLREEANPKLTRSSQSRADAPDWVTRLEFNGNLRGQFEGFYADHPAFVDRNRLRYRLRFGVTAVLLDDFEVGFRLASSERAGNFGGDPISRNALFTDNASSKFVFIDLAYGRWSLIHTASWSGALTLGKMENPFVFSDMVFDPDYTPEGLAGQVSYRLSDAHSLGLNLGGFVVDELSNTSNDSFLVGAQLRFDSKWSPKLATSVGLSGLAISGDEALATAPASPYNGIPDSNVGNTRTPLLADGTGGNLAYSYNPIIADVSLTYTLKTFPGYGVTFPIRVFGEFMHNPAAGASSDGWQTGIVFGKSGKKGAWDIGYRYKSLGADAWFEELVDSDFGAYYSAGPVGSGRGPGYGAGTNVRGHIVRGTYSPFDSLTLGITYFLTEAIDEVPADSDSSMSRLQVDAIWMF